MALSNTAPIKRGVVRRIRSSSPIMTPLRGGIHERISARRVRYPYIVYSEVSPAISRDNGRAGDQGTREIKMLLDISVLSSNQVEAENLDSALDELFTGREQELDALVDGQTVYHCDRISNPPVGPDRDADGRYYVQKGGTYEIWTVQPIPTPGP